MPFYKVIANSQTISTGENMPGYCFSYRKVGSHCINCKLKNLEIYIYSRQPRELSQTNHHFSQSITNLRKSCVTRQISFEQYWKSFQIGDITSNLQKYRKWGLLYHWHFVQFVLCIIFSPPILLMWDAPGIQSLWCLNLGDAYLKYHSRWNWWGRLRVWLGVKTSKPL